jgi:hypothetical protein
VDGPDGIDCARKRSLQISDKGDALFKVYDRCHKGAKGITSANRIAAAFNDYHIATPRGGKWTARSVLNMLARV